jgi:hypothetical protein
MKAEFYRLCANPLPRPGRVAPNDNRANPGAALFGLRAWTYWIVRRFCALDALFGNVSSSTPFS